MKISNNFSHYNTTQWKYTINLDTGILPIVRMHTWLLALYRKIVGTKQKKITMIHFLNLAKVVVVVE